jgi:hypothetical protein
MPRLRRRPDRAGLRRAVGHEGRDTSRVTSSVDLLVPAASSIVSPWYAATPGGVGGMPPHITLLWPWLASPVPEAAIDQVRAAVGDLPPFTMRLGSVDRFPGVLYLAPEPRDRVEELITRLAAAFPATPPYGGAYGPEPTPHLTVAMSPDEPELDAVEQTVLTALARPLLVTVDRVWISESAPGGRWTVRTEVLLRTSPARSPEP